MKILVNELRGRRNLNSNIKIMLRFLNDEKRKLNDITMNSENKCINAQQEMSINKMDKTSLINY